VAGRGTLSQSGHACASRGLSEDDEHLSRLVQANPANELVHVESIVPVYIKHTEQSNDILFTET